MIVTMSTILLGVGLVSASFIGAFLALKLHQYTEDNKSL